MSADNISSPKTSDDSSFSLYKKILKEFTNYIGLSTPEQRKRTLFFVGSVLLEIFNALVYVYLAQYTWGIDDAIKQNFAKLFTACTYYLGAQLVLNFSSSLQEYLTKLTSQSISQEMRQNMIDTWTRGQNHYFLQPQNEVFSAPTGTIIDSVHQVSSSSTLIAHSTLTLPIRMASSLYQIAMISGTLPAAVLGFAVPYYMIYPVLLYAVSSNVLSQFIQKDFKYYNKQWHKYIGKFREQLTYIADNSLGTAAARTEVEDKNNLIKTSTTLHEKFGVYYLLSEASKFATVTAESFGRALSAVLVAPKIFITKELQVAGAVASFKALSDNVKRFHSSVETLATNQAALAKTAKDLEQITTWRTMCDEHETAIKKRNEHFKVSYGAPKNGQAIITVKGLMVSIAGRPGHLLNNTDFTFNGGTSYRFCGPSGDGKSTFLKALTGLWMDVKGEVKYHCPQDKILYIPQSPNDIDPKATLKDIICSGLSEDSIDWKLVKEYMIKLGLEEKWHKMQQENKANEDKTAEEIKPIQTWSRDLSGGEKQKFDLFRVLARKDAMLPFLLILDESMSAFGPEDRATFFTIIHERITKKGGTLIHIGHYDAAEVTPSIKIMIKDQKLGIIVDTPSASDKQQAPANTTPAFTTKITQEFANRPLSAAFSKKSNSGSVDSGISSPTTEEGGATEGFAAKIAKTTTSPLRRSLSVPHEPASILSL